MAQLVFICLLVFTASTALTLSIADTIQEAGDAAAQNVKGLALYKLGKYEEAIKAYKEAINLKKDFAEAHYNLGDAYSQLRDYKKAIEAYKQAIRSQPDFATAYNNLGMAHYKLGEHKKAVAAFKTSVLLNPKSSLTYFNLGATYVERDNKEAALEQYRILKTMDAQVADRLYALIFKLTANVFDSRGTNGVRLNLTATDPQGQPVNDLRQEDFQVFEDGLPQTISLFSKETFPIVYGLALDRSGTFAGELQLGIDVAKAIIQNSSANDETLLVSFVDSDKIETNEDFTTDKEWLNDGLDGLLVEGGQSAILDAVYLTAQRVAQYKVTNGSYLRRALILITDGDERASFYTLDDLLKLLHKIDVQVFAISLDSQPTKRLTLNQNPQKRAIDLLSHLASVTGGRAFFPKSADELQAIPAEITKLLRTQYLIGYKPSKGGPAETPRRVSVNLVDSGYRDKLSVVTRAGYIISDKEK